MMEKLNKTEIRRELEFFIAKILGEESAVCKWTFTYLKPDNTEIKFSGEVLIADPTDIEIDITVEGNETQ